VQHPGQLDWSVAAGLAHAPWSAEAGVDHRRSAPGHPR
jgi:hypothetical protein